MPANSLKSVENSFVITVGDIYKLLQIKCRISNVYFAWKTPYFLTILFLNYILHRQRESVITSRFYKVIEKYSVSDLKNQCFFFSIAYRKTDCLEVFCFSVSWYSLKYVIQRFRHCLQFADMFCSEIFILRNNLSTQPATCFRMKSWSVHVSSKRDSLSSRETCNMALTVEKTNINNVKYNQNSRNKMIVIGQLKK